MFVSCHGTLCGYDPGPLAFITYSSVCVIKPSELGWTVYDYQPSFSARLSYQTKWSYLLGPFPQGYIFSPLILTSYSLEQTPAQNEKESSFLNQNGTDPLLAFPSS